MRLNYYIMQSLVSVHRKFYCKQCTVALRKIAHYYRKIIHSQFPSKLFFANFGYVNLCGCGQTGSVTRIRPQAGLLDIDMIYILDIDQTCPGRAGPLAWHTHVISTNSCYTRGVRVRVVSESLSLSCRLVVKLSGQFIFNSEHQPF